MQDEKGFIKSLSRLRVLDGTTLKLIAMISMVSDHVGDMFFPGIILFRIIGRLAMPLFSFCIAEGYSHTHDRNKYLLRLGLFALISEIPFDLAFSGRPGLEHQNIMLTYFIAILALELYDLIRGSADEESGKYSKGRTALGILAVVAMSGLSLLLRADYTVFAVISVFLFYGLREARYPVRELAGAGFLSVTRTMDFYAFTGICLIPLLLYNGKRGRGMKWLFYVFYPGHLLVLYLIRTFITGGSS